MNTERMLKLADHIETLPKWQFTMTRVSNMRSVGDTIERGTKGCIAGWACILFGVPNGPLSLDYGQGLLGLTELQRNRLFVNMQTYIADGSLRNITNEQAALAIRRMVKEEGDA